MFGEKIYSVICLESHSYYSKGEIYKCEYSKPLDTKYYKIYYGENGGEYQFAHKRSYHCNLDYFEKITTKVPLKYFKSNKIMKKLNRIFNTNFNEYIVTYKNYDFTKINKYGNIYFNILKPIDNIKNSEFFLYHQDKIHYILSSILKLYDMKEHLDFDEQITKYSCLLKDIIKSIDIQDKRVKQEGIKLLKGNIDEYLSKQDKLITTWQTELKELWN